MFAWLLTVPQVAARGVEALMRGDRTVITGWQNKAYVHVLVPLVSGHHAGVQCGFSRLFQMHQL